MVQPMDKMKYEYLVYTWGGFYNEEHAIKHGLKSGNHFFDTAEERLKYINQLKEIEIDLNARHLVYTTTEGYNCRIQQ